MNKNGMRQLMWVLVAIGIVVIALAWYALSGIGSWGTVPLHQPNCIATSGYLCTLLLLTINGNITFSFIENTQVSYYNIMFGCMAQQNYTNGLPAVPNFVIFNKSAARLNVSSGQYINATIKCYGPDNKPIQNLQPGTRYGGYIWVNYTWSSGPPSSSNTWHTDKLGTIYAWAV